MPAVQTTYNETLAPAVEGMVANTEPKVTISRIIESAAGIGFGKVACQGATANTVKVAAAAGIFRGITIHDVTLPPTNGDKYIQKDICALMTKGVIWVLASVNVVASDPVYFVPATGVLTNVVGANILIADAMWDSTAQAGNLAKLRLA